MLDCCCLGDSWPGTSGWVYSGESFGLFQGWSWSWGSIFVLGGSILDGRPSWGVDILARDHLGDLGVVFMVFQVLYRYMAWSSHNSALVMVLEGLVAKEWSWGWLEGVELGHCPQREREAALAMVLRGRPDGRRRGHPLAMTLSRILTGESF